MLYPAMFVARDRGRCEIVTCCGVCQLSWVKVSVDGAIVKGSFGLESKILTVVLACGGLLLSDTE